MSLHCPKDILNAAFVVPDLPWVAFRANLVDFDSPFLIRILLAVIGLGPFSTDSDELALPKDIFDTAFVVLDLPWSLLGRTLLTLICPTLLRKFFVKCAMLAGC